jgi:ubiquinone/menaquinone biosynthesis C-methylase UbiE
MLPTRKDLQSYYDRNTSRFTRFGAGNQTGAIHRKLWGSAVRNSSQALQYTNEIIEKALLSDWDTPTAPKRIMDLGCGIGGTVISFAERHTDMYWGITLSRVQASEGFRRKSKARLKGSCEFVQADFHHIPTPPIWDAAYAIESFVHSPDPDAFFHSVSSCLKPGGRLALCDDFLTACEDQSEALWINRFRRGWLLGKLLDIPSVNDLAQRYSFRLVSDTDLTHLIRTPNRVIMNALKIFSLLPLPGLYWRSVAGGIALAHCHRTGSIQYRLLVFEHREI